MARAGCSGFQITEFINSCNILYGREAWSLTLGERHKKGSQNSARHLILYIVLTNIAIRGCGPVQCLKTFCDEVFITDLKAGSV
jgi:hypothetical protein